MAGMSAEKFMGMVRSRAQTLMVEAYYRDYRKFRRYIVQRHEQIFAEEYKSTRSQMKTVRHICLMALKEKYPADWKKALDIARKELAALHGYSPPESSYIEVIRKLVSLK